jgi:hypothetical protein
MGDVVGQAMWWFGPVVGATGVAVGVLLKWVLDVRSEKARQRREDELRQLEQRRDDEQRQREQSREDALRFAKERLDAYVRFATAAQRLASKRDLSADCEAELLNDLCRMQKDGPGQEILDLLSLVKIIAPQPASEAAVNYFEAIMHQEYEQVVQTEATFLQATREDVGHSST